MAGHTKTRVSLTKGLLLCKAYILPTVKSFVLGYLDIFIRVLMGYTMLKLRTEPLYIYRLDSVEGVEPG